MKFRVGIGRFTGSVVAAVFDLPGCEVNARAIEELRALLPVVIAEHVLWLARHGEPSEASVPSEIDVTGQVDAEASGAADGEFCFQEDLLAVTDDELDRAIRRMAFARQDLTALTRDLPASLLDWRPPSSAMSHIDEWRPGVRTIREIEQDIASAEFYYRTGLSDSLPPQESDAELFDLDLQRERPVTALRAVPAADRGRVYHPQRAWQEGSEHWTMRKVLRRVIGHERFHTREIEQRLAWLLIGVPEFH
jgi:hypothetical protein